MDLSYFRSILEDVRSGRPIVIVDDKDRENEGDIMVAAEKATPETINFMLQEGKGLVCISLTEERSRELAFPAQVTKNSATFGTNFAVSFDHHSVASHGISAEARARSIREAVNPDSTSDDFLRPGFVFPVCAVPGGVLRRRGQTEGSVDLARIAGLSPAGVICEIMDEQGQMLRGEALTNYCRDHSLKIISVEDIVHYRLHFETSLRRVAENEISLPHFAASNLGQAAAAVANGDFQVVVYVDDVDGQEHFALIKGSPSNGCLARIHSECLTGDVFDSLRCDCGFQLTEALEKIVAADEGILIYLHQEGRGIGLGNKLRAYQLQDDKGLDTVDANIELGFDADMRDYRVGAHILNDIGISEVRLMTNNPDKVKSLEDFGVKIAQRVPLSVAECSYNSSYLVTKRERLGHLI